MLSPSIKCGVPINAVGWTSFSGVAKFGDAVASHLSDRQHGYIAAVEAQSYAPYVKCPVLMLCALRDQSFDCDRAYDTFSRIGTEYGNALNYSENSGACIGPNGLINMDLFLAKHLKGREIYVPDTLDITLKETDEGLSVEIESDKEGILQEISVFYAESDVRTKCAYRDWQCIYHVDGKSVTGNKVKFIKKPFAGATAVFAYASAKFINGFSVVSKITAKRLSNPDIHAVKGRMLFSGKEMDAFGVALYDEYSVGDIFLERNAVPKTVEGYGGVTGAFSVGGITTYKISSPTYVPEENAFLEFDAYCREDFVLKVTVDTGDMEQVHERFVVEQTVKGGGKWKRIILKAGDFKSEISGMPLRTFRDGKALTFDCDDERIEYAITNILWL
jgi:hypothetical protein